MLPASFNGGQRRQSYDKSRRGLWHCSEAWWKESEWHHMAGAKASKRTGWCVDLFLSGTCSPVSWYFRDVPSSWTARQTPSISPAWLWHFKSLNRLVHATGWIQRFLTNCRLPMNLWRKDLILLPTEISEAETFRIKQAQAQAFPEGENEGSLTRLNPKNDSDGLFRMDGRLCFANQLPYSTRHPILLPKDHL